jgi:3D (Asp-Asp-Asp) domain-containing protein/peptidoglycan hydrolase CwlO-like protein
VRRSRRQRLPAAALLVGLAVALAAPGAGEADTATRIRSREHTVLLELYALESRFDSARSRLAALDSTAARLSRERTSISLRLRAARSTLRRAQRELGAALRALYEQERPDPLAVFLSASSLQDALDGVDDLARAASAIESVIAQSQSARADVARLARELDDREQTLGRVRQRAAAEVARLEQARGERSAYLGELLRRQRIDQRRVAELESRARAAQASAHAASVRASAESSIASITARAPLEPQHEGPRPGLASSDLGQAAGLRTIVVVSTGYSLPGTTATGLPVGHGIVAVDPTVIPLGTRMTIPGYGEAVAADTGSAIKGVRIDIWFPTRKRALAWGWQTLTVTLH